MCGSLSRAGQESWWMETVTPETAGPRMLFQTLRGSAKLSAERCARADVLLLTFQHAPCSEHRAVLPVKSSYKPVLFIKRAASQGGGKNMVNSDQLKLTHIHDPIALLDTDPRQMKACVHT